MHTTPLQTRAARKSRAAKLLSATSTSSRPGSHLRACRTTCLPHLVSFLDRLPEMTAAEKRRHQTTAHQQIAQAVATARDICNPYRQRKRDASRQNDAA